MSDAHLHTTCPKCIERAAELVRLAGERDYWKSLHDNEQKMRREADAKVALLASAGPHE